MLDAAVGLTKLELFARLADGHAAQTTVVTPNRRLAQTLAREFDQRQLARGRTTWETADVLPYGAFVQRLYDDALYSPRCAELPQLLSPDQEQTLWEDIVHSEVGSVLLAVSETAALAREAWQLVHEWNALGELRGPMSDEDSAAFVRWARQYMQRTERERLTDRARLPAIAAEALNDPRVKKPQLLVVYAFDLVTPQQEAFFAALTAGGVQVMRSEPTRRSAKAVRLAATDGHDEFRRAACWARARLESNAAARIGIVVPDLTQRKDALRRTLAQTMMPDGAGSVLPFNISLGEPLTAYPLAAHALAMLALGGREIEYERASIVIRSPFVGGEESEREQRDQLDAKLRRRAERVMTLDALARQANGGIAQRFGAYTEFRKARLFGAQSPGEWARAFNDALAQLGFPGQRALDSAEYQTLKKWHDLLARFAGLERVAAHIGFDQALARLQRMAAQTLFQPDTPDAPIQVLGVLEAAGMEFDHLWVIGLSDQVWPMHARPNPFVPLRVQRAAGVPYGSPAGTLDLAKRLTAEWLGAAGEVVLSHPRREKDRDLAPSPLIAHIAETELALPTYETWREAIRRRRSIERIPDARAPALVPQDATRGGATLIKDQAACAFRAFAVHRLRAKSLEAPHTGLDQGERGSLVHDVLAKVWGVLQGKSALDALSNGERQSLLAAAVDEAISRLRRERPSTLAGRFAEIEKARLIALADEWLDYEQRRGDFTVVAREERRALQIGALKLSVRLDRVDELDSGARVVLDYKTGVTTLRSLCGARPDEPQLPLYLATGAPEAAGAAFAQVRSGDTKFVGFAREENLLPGVKPPGKADRRSGAELTWRAQEAFWRAEIDRLAHEFAAGHAEVAPKKGIATCRTCDLQPLCRIHERMREETE